MAADVLVGFWYYIIRSQLHCADPFLPLSFTYTQFDICYRLVGQFWYNYQCSCSMMFNPHPRSPQCSQEGLASSRNAQVGYWSNFLLMLVAPPSFFPSCRQSQPQVHSFCTTSAQNQAVCLSAVFRELWSLKVRAQQGAPKTRQFADLHYQSKVSPTAPVNL